MRGLIRAAVNRPISTLMLFASFILIGVVAISSLGVAELPDIRVPKLIVSTSYPGLPAAETRLLVTRVVEDALVGLRGLKHMESLSRPGVSSISLEFNWGQDMRGAGVEARELIDAIQGSLPEGASKPQVLPVDPNDETLAVIGVFPRDGDLTMARRLAEREIRTRFQQLRGVGSAVVVGGLQEEAHIEIDRQLLAGRNLDLPGLARVVAASNGDYPGGVLTEGEQEFVVKAHGSLENAQSLATLLIPANKGAFVALGELGSVSLATAEPLSHFSAFGKTGVGLYLHRQAGVSPIEAAQSIKSELRRVQETWDKDLECVLVSDASQMMSRSLSDLIGSGLLGMTIALVVLWFFIRDIPLSLIIMSSVPVAILMSLTFLWACGKTVNLMSIGGLALGIGMMVDNSVVVLENIQRRCLGSQVSPQMVIEATAELSLSNIGSTGTSIIVFIPVMFMPGVVGAVFTDLSLAVVGAQVASFIVSVSLVPVLFLLFSGGKQRPEKPNAFLRGLEAFFAKAQDLIGKKPQFLGLILLVSLIAGALAYFSLPFRFMPSVDSGLVAVTVEAPFGTPIEKVAAIGLDIQDIVGRQAGVDHVFARCGGESDDWFYQSDPSDRSQILHIQAVLTTGNRPTAASIAKTLQQIVRIDDMQAQVSLPANPVSRLLGLREDVTRIVVMGSSPESADESMAFAEKSLRELPAKPDILVYPQGQQEELHFLPDRAELARTATSLSSVAECLNAGLEGLPAGSLKTGGRDIPIRLRMRASDRQNRQSMAAYMVRGDGGALVSLSNLGKIETSLAPWALLRSDRMDSHVITVKGHMSGPQQAMLSTMAAASFPDQAILMEQAGQFLLILVLVLVLLYLFLGAQLQSMILPLVIMVTIPLSFSGLFIALALGQSSINIDSLLGIIVLIGVVINNSIILYETYSQLLAHGGAMDLETAIREGTRTRLRPIVMTVSISMIAMLPVAIDSSGTSTQSSMALAVIGGLAMSTFLTLLVIPWIFRAYFQRRGSHV